MKSNRLSHGLTIQRKNTVSLARGVSPARDLFGEQQHYRGSHAVNDRRINVR